MKKIEQDGIRIIFDGNNTAYRANVVTELCTKQGERTSAIIGTLNITHNVIQTLEKELDKPVKEVIFAWDMGHSKRRLEVYPEYKHNRKKEFTPEDNQWMDEFKKQANLLHDNLPLFGVKSIRFNGWEGDDVIFGIVSLLKNSQDTVVIVSTDEDFHQLISSNVSIFSPIKKVFYTQENYKEMMGIEHDSFLTYKILKGDSSDGISGIAGIGDKTAKTIVNKYNDIDGIFDNAEELKKSKRTAKIFTKEGLEILDRNNKLINLIDYVDTSDIIDEIKEILLEYPVVDVRESQKFLTRYQLVSILTKYRSWIMAFDSVTDNFSPNIK